MGGKVELVSVLRRRLASACAEDPGIASWGDRDRWRMTMMIVSISVCSGHIQLSTTTVYLEGSRFDIWPSLIWREPVVTAPVHGRLWKKFIAQLVEIRQIWFINLRRNIIHEASCWRDARMRPNIASSIYIYIYTVSCNGQSKIKAFVHETSLMLVSWMESKHRRLTQRLVDWRISWKLNFGISTIVYNFDL